MEIAAFAQKDDVAQRIVQSLKDEEDGSSYRSKFARDRDRIVFCKSYRRLIHKMQLYLLEHDDHRRTRLTHTLEVVQIARAIAKKLGMNEGLVEAIGFGHDIGHTPFGHAGERAIDRLLKETSLPRYLSKSMTIENNPDTELQEDFKHNFQSVRVLTFLEEYHPLYPGLNLTIQTLEGILKHTKIKPISSPAKFCQYPDPDNLVFAKLSLDCSYSVTVEGQIVALADDIAQIVHDLDDALGKKVIGRKEISSINEIESIVSSLKDYSDDMYAAQLRALLLKHFITRASNDFMEALTHLQPNDYTKANGSNIKLNKQLLSSNSDPVHTALKNFHEKLFNKVGIHRMDGKGEYIVKKLYNAYLTRPLYLTDRVLDQYHNLLQKRIIKDTDAFKLWVDERKKRYHIPKKEEVTAEDIVTAEDVNALQNTSLRSVSKTLVEKWLPYMVVDKDFRRCIADHIANMTDDYAREEVAKLYMPR